MHGTPRDSVRAAIAIHSDIVGERLNLSGERLIACAMPFGYENTSPDELIQNL